MLFEYLGHSSVSKKWKRRSCGRGAVHSHERARDVVACFARQTHPETPVHDALCAATAMSTAAGPSAVRGDITLQPSYFTSSLYVEPLREDIANLVNLFAQQPGMVLVAPQGPRRPRKGNFHQRH